MTCFLGSARFFQRLIAAYWAMWIMSDFVLPKAGLYESWGLKGAYRMFRNLHDLAGLRVRLDVHSSRLGDAEANSKFNILGRDALWDSFTRSLSTGFLKNQSCPRMWNARASRRVGLSRGCAVRQKLSSNPCRMSNKGKGSWKGT